MSDWNSLPEAAPSPQTGKVLFKQLHAELVWLWGKGKVIPIHLVPRIGQLENHLGVLALLALSS